MTTWIDWFDENKERLWRGEHVEVPRSLPHPSEVGFEALNLAENVGQIQNFALSLNDESRLHAHVFADGRLVVHRDKHDPRRGLLKTLLHFFTESKTGQAALVIGAIAGTAYMLTRDE